MVVKTLKFPETNTEDMTSGSSGCTANTTNTYCNKKSENLHTDIDYALIKI